MRYRWMHFFHADARSILPDNLAVEHHVARNGFPQAPPVVNDSRTHDTKVAKLIFALFAPIVHDYGLTAKSLGTSGDPLEGASPPRYCANIPQLFFLILKRRLKRRSSAASSRMASGGDLPMGNSRR